MTEGRAKTRSLTPAGSADPSKAPPEPKPEVSPKVSGAPRSPEQARSDVVLLGPPTDDGAGVHVLRARDEGLEAGELRMLEEGRPITGEVVTLSPRKANPRICDVKESFRAEAGAGASAPASARARKGPAQVATKEYRDHWEETFAPRSRSDLN